MIEAYDETRTPQVVAFVECMALICSDSFVGRRDFGINSEGVSMTTTQLTPICVGQYLSDGRMLVQVTRVGENYISAIDCSVSLDEDMKVVTIPAREIDHNWYRIYSERSISK